MEWYVINFNKHLTKRGLRRALKKGGNNLQAKFYIKADSLDSAREKFLKRLGDTRSNKRAIASPIEKGSNLEEDLKRCNIPIADASEYGVVQGWGREYTLMKPEEYSSSRRETTRQNYWW